METVLTIAGSDPSCGAGIQADLQVFRTLEVQGLTAITAITAQSEKRFYSLNPVSSTLLREQLRSVVGVQRPKVVKIGMLGTEENAMAVLRFLDAEKLETVVLDPVQRSSTGALLLTPKGMVILKEYLIPKVTVVTPNLDEARALTGLKIRTIEQMKEAAITLHQVCRGVRFVLLKGGHLEEEPVDVLYDGKEWHLLEQKGHRFPEAHGTGCVHSAALAAYIARGETVPEAARLAKRFVTDWFDKRR